MKSVLIISFLLSSNLFAGRIVPNIQWNQLTQNQTGAASSWFRRKNINYGYTRTEYDDKKSTTDDSRDITHEINTFIPVGKRLNIEASASKYHQSYSDKSQSSRTDVLNFQTGFLATEKVSLGLEYTNSIENKLGNSANESINTIGLSTSINIKDNLYVGGGLTKNFESGDGFDQKTLSIGAGIFEEDKIAAEGYLAITPSEESKGVTRAGNVRVVGTATANLSEKLQVLGGVLNSISIIKKGVTDTESINRTLIAGFEYKTFDNFFVGSQAFFGKTEYEDKKNDINNYESKSYGIGLNARVKLNNIQGIVNIAKNKSATDYRNNSKTDNKSEINSYSFNIAYFF